MSKLRVFIVRHGQTEYNISHRWQGQLDIPLNEHGQLQAQRIADYLRDTHFDAIYSSDMRRAYDTTTAITDGRQLTVVSDARLREFNLGILQGMTRAEMRAAHQDILNAWDASDDYVIPQGESRSMTRERAQAFWRETIAPSPHRQLLIVTHGGTKRLLIDAVTDAECERIKFYNTSLSILEQDDDHTWKVIALNTTPHLADDQR